MRVIDLFAGVGGWSEGARQAWHEVIAAVEHDPIAADYYARNHGSHVICADILNVNPHDMPAAEILLASPPCPNFSIAKAGGKETDNDITLARKVAEFITTLRPRFVFLENVYAYRKSQSWAIVQDALSAAGFWHDLNHFNAADFAVPQTRKRMIVRAIRKAEMPLLPQKLPWQGWYAAIEDLLDTLPESKFAPWQEKRLHDNYEDLENFLVNATDSGKEARHNPRPGSAPAPTLTTTRQLKAFLVGGGNTNIKEGKPGKGVLADWQPAHTVAADQGAPRAFLVGTQHFGTPRCQDDPAPTITSAHTANKYRAFLMDSQNSRGGSRPSVRMAEEPSFTVTAQANKGQSRAWLSRGRVVSMTPHALARFQSFPDTTIWPEGKSAATRLIGNAVPPLMAAALLKELT